MMPTDVNLLRTTLTTLSEISESSGDRIADTAKIERSPSQSESPMFFLFLSPKLSISPARAGNSACTPVRRSELESRRSAPPSRPASPSPRSSPRSPLLLANHSESPLLPPSIFRLPARPSNRSKLPTSVFEIINFTCLPTHSPSFFSCFPPPFLLELMLCT